uniref:Uncharacterized protein n=1 Tax=Triticum urartu TaxID=4572 RepID=A0A8R7Q517_TRIUA
LPSLSPPLPSSRSVSRQCAAATDAATGVHPSPRPVQELRRPRLLHHGALLRHREQHNSSIASRPSVDRRRCNHVDPPRLCAPNLSPATLSHPTPRPLSMSVCSTTSKMTPPSCQSNQMLEPRSQTPPSTTTPTTPEVPTTT